LANALRNLGRREQAVRLVWEQVAANELCDVQDAHADHAACCDVSKEQDLVWTDKTPVCCSHWEQSRQSAPQDLHRGASSDCDIHTTVVCVKWGKRYGADYVNRLCAGVRRHHPINVPFICFTDDAEGLEDVIEVRPLPGNLPIWWGKAFLFSEAAGLDGNRILYLDLDQVVVGSLVAFVSYRGPFALLSTDGIACELASGGYNSSVMAWESGPFFRPIFDRLSRSALRYVHRFDHWLEMNVHGADVWQVVAPGCIVDYTAAFRGGICLGAKEEEENLAGPGAFAVASPVEESVALPDEETPLAASRVGAPSPLEPPPGSAVVTFPRFPKPHEVLAQHAWVRRHWLGAAEETLQVQT